MRRGWDRRRGEDAATAAEIGVDADFPTAIVHDRRTGPVIEAILVKVGYRSIGAEFAAAEVVVLVKGDLVCHGRTRGDRNEAHQQGCQYSFHHVAFWLRKNPEAGSIGSPRARRTTDGLTRRPSSLSGRET
jgi:hypothetical protein